MPILLTCPGCTEQLNVPDELTGKKVRCKKCGHIFRSDPGGQSEGTAPRRARAAAAIATEPDPSPPASAAERPARPKKKQKTDDSSRRMIIGVAIGGGVLALFLFIGVVVAIVLLGGPPEPRQMLIGKWTGTTNAREPKQISMDDPNVNARSMLGAFAEKQFRDMEKVKIDFRQNGTANFSGNTGCLDIEKGGEGKWEVLRRDGDVLFMRMGPGGEQFEAKLTFSGTEAFILTRTDTKYASPVLFTLEK